MDRELSSTGRCQDEGQTLDHSMAVPFSEGLDPRQKASFLDMGAGAGIVGWVAGPNRRRALGDTGRGSPRSDRAPPSSRTDDGRASVEVSRPLEWTSTGSALMKKTPLCQPSPPRQPTSGPSVLHPDQLRAKRFRGDLLGRAGTGDVVFQRFAFGH